MCQSQQRPRLTPHFSKQTDFPCAMAFHLEREVFNFNSLAFCKKKSQKSFLFFSHASKNVSNSDENKLINLKVFTRKRRQKFPYALLLLDVQWGCAKSFAKSWVWDFHYSLSLLLESCLKSISFSSQYPPLGVTKRFICLWYGYGNIHIIFS